MSATSTAPRVGGRPPAVQLSADTGRLLLRLARAAVLATASGQPRSSDPDFVSADLPAEVLAPASAFVTLYRAGELRGCMGSIGTGMSLWDSVATAAANATRRDWRFPPVTEPEVVELTIDVSVLGPEVPLEDPAAFRPGVDGLIVERGERHALLLPEVATDQEWGTSQMLEATCWKAGLPDDAWRDPATRLYVFRTVRFSEADELRGGARRRTRP